MMSNGCAHSCYLFSYDVGVSLGFFWGFIDVDGSLFFCPFVQPYRFSDYVYFPLTRLRFANSGSHGVYL